MTASVYVGNHARIRLKTNIRRIFVMDFIRYTVLIFVY